MKLENFTVTKFRSIILAHKISLSNNTILIGKNNEGKSNILKALEVAMVALQEHGSEGKDWRTQTRKVLRGDYNLYNWETDFPIGLQSRQKDGRSQFTLVFKLENDELKEFRDKIKSNLNGTLPIKIEIGNNNRPNIWVAKNGKGGPALTDKSGKIAKFIADRIVFNYIPAIRTDQEALDVIKSMLSRRLKTLEQDKKYKDALDTIKELQSPIINELSESIKNTLIEFLPNIKNVKIEMSERRRAALLRSELDVVIDDGTPTYIEYKGDGVKSLVSLSLLKNQGKSKGASIIAIEEPESHLHPSAIHQVNEVILALATSNQVILSTHNPLFVDRINIKSNILVDAGKAKSADSIKEVRELLGIHASDNLINAKYVIVTEGLSDVISLSAILSCKSSKIKNAIDANLLVFDNLNGSGNLSSKLSLVRSSLCLYHVVLDNDDAGKQAANSAMSRSLLDVKDCTMITCQGMKVSELEDCFITAVYAQVILNKFSVDVNGRIFKDAKGKWSDRMRELFHKSGKLWNDKIECEVKTCVAECIQCDPLNSLDKFKGHAIEALINELELKIDD